MPRVVDVQLGNDRPALDPFSFNLMATDFWASSHYKRWIIDRATVKEARAEDLQYVPEPDHLDFLSIYFADTITGLGKKLSLRQRVIATATVFFRRFYLKNSYCETDPYLVLAACCYVAAKAEESPVHIKTVVGDSRIFFSNSPYNIKNFPSDNAKLAEMEFYLVGDLECDLVVFHPYRTLLALVCKKEANAGNRNDSSALMDAEEGEADEMGIGIGAEEGRRYWGTGQGKLELSTGALQTAWFIINDTYRSDLCLLYPPHLIAITAIYLTLVLHTPTQNSVAHLIPYSSAFNSTPSTDSTATPGDSPTGSNTSQQRRSSRPTRQTADPAKASSNQQDPIAFLADLNVSLSAVSTIAQEIIAMYSLWDRFRSDPPPEGNNSNRFSQISQQHSHSQSSRMFPASAPPSNTAAHMQQQFMRHLRFQPVTARPSVSPLSPAKRSSTGALISRSGANSTSGSVNGSGGSGSGTPDSHQGAGASMEDLFGDASSGSPASQLSGHVATPGSASGGPDGVSSGAVLPPSNNPSSVNPWPFGQGPVVTPLIMAYLLIRMREARSTDLAHPPSGRPVAVHRMLERVGGSG